MPSAGIVCFPHCLNILLNTETSLQCLVKYISFFCDKYQVKQVFDHKFFSATQVCLKTCYQNDLIVLFNCVMLITSLRFNNYILELKISFIIKTSCNTDELSITETLKND